LVDYLVINVSSPNTPGLRSLQTKETLEPLVAGVKNVCGGKPLFIKVAPDRFKDFQDGVLALAQTYDLAGIICGNTLGDHQSAGIPKKEEGGLSGAPIHRFNLELLRSYHKAAPHLYFMGVGGIDSQPAAEAYFKAGASLVQLYSGFVYEGPRLVAEIAQAAKN
jgi:dihydroorotate dehydrogenase